MKNQGIKGSDSLIIGLIVPKLSLKLKREKSSMARLTRLYIPGCSHHVIQRGNNRQACFFDEMDYAFYLDKLREAAEKHQVAIHAFVLMTNHVHLVGSPK